MLFVARLSSFLLLGVMFGACGPQGCVIDLTGGAEGEGEGEGEGAAGEGEGTAGEGEGEGTPGEGEGEGAAGEGEGEGSASGEGEGEGGGGEGEGEGEGEGANPNAPVVTINAPANNDVEEACAPVALSCNAVDPNGASVTFSWLDGATEVAQTADATFTPNSAGTHTLTCNATSTGGTGTASVTVTVNAVHVQINHPGANDGARTQGQAFPLIAVACSASLGNITTDSDYSWSSSLDGALGTGASLNVNAAQAPLSIGTHTITVTASDGLGNQAQASRDVVIQQ